MTGPRHRLGGYREYAPAPDAARFCEAFWFHRTPPGPVAPGAAHRVLPDLAVSLAFHTVRDDEGRPLDGGPIVIGPKLRPQIFTLVPGCELAAIRLKPEWVAPILGIDPLAIENAIIDLSQIRPRLAARLGDQLLATRTPHEAIAILTRVATDTPASRTVPPPAAADALELVRRTAGSLPCERIADEIGVSLRHLRRQVHDATGLSPKSYARVIRFVASIQRADRATTPSWADIAARGGYCDQSHFIREAIALAGASPRELFVERRRQVVAAPEPQ